MMTRDGQAPCILKRLRLPLMPFEILHGAFLLFGGGAACEGAEVATPAGLRVFLREYSRYLPEGSLRIMPDFLGVNLVSSSAIRLLVPGSFISVLRLRENVRDMTTYTHLEISLHPVQLFCRLDARAR